MASCWASSSTLPNSPITFQLTLYIPRQTQDNLLRRSTTISLHPKPLSYETPLTRTTHHSHPSLQGWGTYFTSSSVQFAKYTTSPHQRNTHLPPAQSIIQQKSGLPQPSQRRRYFACLTLGGLLSWRGGVRRRRVGRTSRQLDKRRSGVVRW